VRHGNAGAHPEVYGTVTRDGADGQAIQQDAQVSEGSPSRLTGQPPLLLPARVRPQQPPQLRPHADQRIPVQQLLQILSLRLRQQQGIQDEALAAITHVIHTAAGPGHVQRQLDFTRSRALQVVERRRQTTGVLTPTWRQTTRLHEGNYPIPRVSGLQARRASSPALPGGIARKDGRRCLRSAWAGGHALRDRDQLRAQARRFPPGIPAGSVSKFRYVVITIDASEPKGGS